MIPDIVEIKRLCASGQWYTKIENGQILLHDTVADETVCIGQADAEPVRHGRWVNPHMNKYGHPCHNCSECGFQASQKDRNYCPNCGVMMKEE